MTGTNTADRYWVGPETVRRVEGDTDSTTSNPRVTALSETGGLVSTTLDAFEGQFRRQERHKSKAPRGRVERNSCPCSLFSLVSHAPVVSFPVLSVASVSASSYLCVPSVLNRLGNKGSSYIFGRLLLLSLAITLLAWAPEKSGYICSPGCR